jgi:hypothetical protein
MKYQLSGPWAVGQFLLPADTVIDDTLQQWAYLQGIGPPKNAIPLTQATYNYMCDANGVIGLGYGYWEVRPGPGVVGIRP